MSLIDKMILIRIEKLGRKLIRLNNKVVEYEKERDNMKENLKHTSIYNKFIENYFGDKIYDTKQKISRVEKALVKNYDKYSMRNSGGLFNMSGRYPECYEQDEKNL